MRRNKHRAPGVQLAFLFSQINVNSPFLDVQNLILPKVLVRREFLSGPVSSVTMNQAAGK